MKIKFGDLTVSQMKEICDKYKRCNDGCPLFIDMGSDRKCASTNPWAYNTETEINLPDNEVKTDDTETY